MKQTKATEAALVILDTAKIEIALDGLTPNPMAQQQKIHRMQEHLMSETQEVRTADGMVLSVGTEIYYTGDMANSESEGVIERLYADKWGRHIVVRLDDRDKATHLTLANFEPGPGRRFMTLQRQREEHAAAIAKMRADYEARKAAE